MVALLDILEDPADLDASDDAEGMDLLAPGGSADAPNSSPGRKERRMTRTPRPFAGTIVLAVFLPSLWSPSPVVRNRVRGRACTRGGRGCRGSDRAEIVSEGESISPERLERWRAMPPEERERIRERYRRWKELPPEKRERILERHRRWRELPEEQRRYLKERRELLKDAGPEDRVVVRKFFARMRSLPPEARGAARQRIREWRSLPPGETRGGDGLLALLPRAFRSGTRHPPVVPVRAARGTPTP